MKKFLIIVLVFTLTACGSKSTPESTVRAYLQAEAISDTKTMQALVLPGTQPNENWFASQIGEHVLRVELKNLDTDITRLDQKRVRVHVSGTAKYSFSNPVDLAILPKELNIPIPVDRSFVTTQLDGTWYIVPGSE